MQEPVEIERDDLLIDLGHLRTSSGVHVEIKFRALGKLVCNG